MDNNLGKINSYKPYIVSKRVYLKRKKFINKKIRELRRCSKGKKYWTRRYCNKQIKLWSDELYLLRIMFNYYKYKSKHNP